jgi:dienelactone hydrolase
MPRSETLRDPITFESDGRKIFGVIHRSAARAPGRQRPGIAIYHGLVGSKDQPHRIFVTLAERLARDGSVALRIDLPGRGDSEGDGLDMTVRADMHAARKTIDVLASQPDVDRDKLAAVGMSWGGSIAASLAGGDERISSLALWSCMPDDLDWTPEYQTFDGREAQDMWGNLVGRQFFEGLRDIDPIRDIARARGPVLLVYGTADESVAVGAVERVKRALDGAGIAHEIIGIEGADHAFMRHAWEREVIDITCAWLKRTLA